MEILQVLEAVVCCIRKVPAILPDLSMTCDMALSEEQVAKLFRTANAERRRNFLLIVSDDLNIDSIGLMGGVAPNVSPSIDKLASESQVFSRTYATTSVCQPSSQATYKNRLRENA